MHLCNKCIPSILCLFIIFLLLFNKHLFMFKAFYCYSYLYILLAFYAFIANVSCTPFKRDHESRLYFTVKIPNTSLFSEHMTEITEQLNARYEGPVGELQHYHWISVSSLPTTFPTIFGLDRRISHEDVIIQFHNKSKRRSKRGSLLPFDDADIQSQIPERRLYKRIPQSPAPLPPPPPPVIENQQEELRLNSNIEKVKASLNITDPGFDRQWHLFNSDEFGHDMNVTGVWRQGITGQNVVIAIVDDGLDMNHEDLKDNYFADGSYDFNDHVKDPKPRLSDDVHGTRCAGEIAAQKNDICGLGVAYDAKVAGIRILSGDITQADEATAINYAYQQTHIYSCSWGPRDDGTMIEGPKGIVLDAFLNGIEYGRNGLGSIFVFASGNGGSYGDNCNFDGYTNSIYTVTVGAVDKSGNHPPYAERCAAQLVVAYSSGSGRYIYTTDVGATSQCSERHGGTSAAAPLASGVFALVLSIRPDLSWRDLQHLCVQTAVPITLDDDDWVQLPSGRMFNHKFGYGALDAYRIVEAAKQFKSVRQQVKVEVVASSERQQGSSASPDADSAIVATDIVTNNDNTNISRKTFTSTAFVTQRMIDQVGLSRLEHVTATVSMKHPRRGDFEYLLSSPNGVVSQLGTPRPHDKSEAGLKNWTFMTVKHWEEKPIVGNWTLRIIDTVKEDVSLLTDDTINWKLTLWGEVVENFAFESNDNENGSKSTTHIGVDDFDTEDNDESEHDSDSDNNENTKQEETMDEIAAAVALAKESSYMIYSIVTASIILGAVFTAFLVRNYMLRTTRVNYIKAPIDEDDVENVDTLRTNSAVEMVPQRQQQQRYPHA